MNNYHIYEEIGKGKYSIVYKVLLILYPMLFITILREGRKKALNMSQ